MNNSPGAAWLATPAPGRRVQRGVGLNLKKHTTMKSTHKPAFAALWRGRQNLFAIALLAALAFTTTIARAADALPSWNDTAPKKAIVAFVEKVTKEGSPDFVPAPERIAT